MYLMAADKDGVVIKDPALRILALRCLIDEMNRVMTDKHVNPKQLKAMRKQKAKRKAQFADALADFDKVYGKGNATRFQ
jgi:fructoselysine-6-P-deglycase FrlB-like protein